MIVTRVITDRLTIVQQGVWSKFNTTETRLYAQFMILHNTESHGEHYISRMPK